MKTKISYLLLVCSFYVNAQQQVSFNEAIKVASQSVKSNSILRAATVNTIDTVHCLKNTNNDTLMYEVTFADGKAVLLSGSKACLPVLGYVNMPIGKSVFDDDMPDGLKFMLQEYKEQIELCFANDTISLYHLNNWQTLQNTVQLRSATIEVVSPLLTSHWHQGSPYNYYAPACDVEENTPAGCVAIAMAQIMYYWKYPVFGHDWCNMRDYVYSYYPEKQRIAVARLVKVCADAVDMNYACDGSEAQSSDVRDAFVETFGYGEDADYQQKFWHSNTTWKNRIKENLNNGRPVYYAGQRVDNFIGVIPVAGHAFVCDGYGNDDTFHFNFGYGESYDAWLKLDNLVPNGINKDYSSYQIAIFYLHPENENLNYCDIDLPMTDFLYTFSGLASVIPSSSIKSLQANLKPTRLISVDVTTPRGAVISVAWHNVLSGETVEYVAHKEITLRPGFHAQAGSTFTARIEPCTNCENENSAYRSVRVSVDLSEEELELIESKETLQSDKPISAGNFDFNIYPNPNDGKFTVDVTGNTQSYTVEVFSTSGALLDRMEHCNAKQLNINRSDLPSGVYYVKLSMGEHVAAKKIIVK